jgi:hypothetical protein
MDTKPLHISVQRDNSSGKMISLTFFGQANKDKQSGRESSKKSKNEKSDHKKTLKIS